MWNRKEFYLICNECGTEKNFISAGARAAVHAYSTAFQRRPQFLDWKEILVFGWFQMEISNEKRNRIRQGSQMCLYNKEEEWGQKKM